MSPPIRVFIRDEKGAALGASRAYLRPLKVDVFLRGGFPSPKKDKDSEVDGTGGQTVARPLCRTPFARREPIFALTSDGKLLKFELKAPLFALLALKFELQMRLLKPLPYIFQR